MRPRPSTCGAYVRSPIRSAGMIARRWGIWCIWDTYLARRCENCVYASSTDLTLTPALLSRATACSNSSRSTSGSLVLVKRKYHDRSSTRWLPTVNIKRAGPSSSSSTALMTRVAASITAPNEFSQASLSWLDRKYRRIGYARWLSSTAAVHLRQSSKVLTSSSRSPRSNTVSSSWVPEGGAPARASSWTTISSRSWNGAYKEKRSVITRAAIPTPVALSNRLITRAPAPIGTKSPYLKCTIVVAEKERDSPQLSTIGRIWVRRRAWIKA